MSALLSFMVGIALSASCGFRIFVPLLGMSIACKAGHLTLAPGFEWIGSWPAILAFGIATVLEIGAYYIPWLDNALDTVATPAAVVAGTIVTASMVGDISPFLKWSLAVIAGGGAAAATQAATVAVRGGSAATTGGLGNPAVSTGELAASTVGTVMVLVYNLLAIAVIAIIAFIAFLVIKKLFFSRQKPAT